MSSNPTTETAEPEADFVLTPEILRAENRRNDYVIAAGVLCFALFLGLFKESGEDIWLWLRRGKDIAQTLPAFSKTDTLSYTRADQPYVDFRWLFELGLYEVYHLFGDKVLVALKAASLVFLTFVLLSIRHPGPTLWWTALCVMSALVAMCMRFGVGPDVANLTFLAILLWLWHQAKDRDRFKYLYLAIPLTALWANIDLQFIVAPVVLLTLAVGEGFQLLLPSRLSLNPPRRGRETLLLLIAGLSLGAALLNPYGLDGLLMPYRWVTEVLPNVPRFERQASSWYSSTWTTKEARDAFVEQLIAGRRPYSEYAWIVTWSAAALTTVLNARHFSVSRFLLLVLSTAMAAWFDRLMPTSAVILATVASLNGQEFFLSRFGVEPRLSRGWLFWSQGGRAVTVVVVFFSLLAALTGRVQGMVGRFGVGFVHERYMQDAAQWLDRVRPKGNGFAMVNRVANYLLWAAPEQKNFVDGRWQVFPDVYKQYNDTRVALLSSEEKSVDAWKKTFDEHNITFVVIDPSDRRLRERVGLLLQTPNMAPLFISDQAVIMGRTDKTVDQALFASERIKANKIVFREDREGSKPTERYVEPPGWIDWLWRTRQVDPPELVCGSIYSTGVPSLEQPGANYLAIMHLRRAVASNPDNAEAQLQLGLAYNYLYRREALEVVNAREQERERESAKSGVSKQPDLTGNAASAAEQPPFVGPTPQARRLAIPPSRTLLPYRHYQIMSCLQAAVAAGPLDHRADFLLYEVSRENGLYDLALHHLLRALKFGTLPPQSESQLRNQLLAPLQLEVDKRQLQYQQAVAERTKQLEQAGATPDRPLERAQFALQAELPMLASEQLESISPFGPEMVQAAPLAVVVYLLLGKPDKAESYLAEIRNQQQLPAGEWHWSMAAVRLVSGQYDEARDLLEAAIAQVRRRRTERALAGFEVRARAGDILRLPMDVNTLVSDLERESMYHFALGLLRIEKGEPSKTPREFSKALEIFPRLGMRPIIGLYWGLITDKPLPAEAPPFDPESEIVRRFASATDKGSNSKPASSVPASPVLPAPSSSRPTPTPGAARSANKPATEKKAVEKKTP